MRRHAPLLWLLVGMLFASGRSQAQGDPAAVRTLQLSGFALLGNTYTGLSTPVTNRGGRNLTTTMGIDAGLYHTQRIAVDGEVRGAYPAYSGHVDGQETLLAGARVRYRFSQPRMDRLQLYANFLAGRGAIRYVDGGYPTPSILYLRSTSAVYSAGGGLEYALTRQWALRGDVQFQHWNTPVIPGGTILSVQGSAGLGFALRFGGDKPH